MRTQPATVVARVPVVVRCLDAHGRAVSLSARALGAGSTSLQELLRWAYTTARPTPGTEEVTVSFHEEGGQLPLEYLVVDRAPRRRLRRRDRNRTEEVRSALVRATLIVTTMVETVGAVAAAGSARWVGSDRPDFVDLVLDGRQVLRVPTAVRTGLGAEPVLELLRGILLMFVEDDVEQLVIGKDPDIPDRYRESVVTRSSALLRFTTGAPLAALRTAGPGPEPS